MDTLLVLSGAGVGAELFEPMASEPGANLDAGASAPVWRTGLRTESGEEIGLREVRLLESQVLCASNYRIAEPLEPLEPNTRYGLFTRYELLYDRVVHEFTTGTESTQETEPALIGELRWSTVGLVSSPDRVSSVFVEGFEDEPLLIQVRAEETVVHFHDGRMRQGPLKLPALSANCPEIEVVRLNGNTLTSVSLCTPERCVPDADIIFGASSCGGNGSDHVSWEQFHTLSEDSCAVGNASPTPVESGPQGPGPSPGNEPMGPSTPSGVGAPEQDPTTEDDSTGSGVGTRAVDEGSDTGCSLGTRVRGTTSSAWLASLLGSVLLLRRRSNARGT